MAQAALQQPHVDEPPRNFRVISGYGGGPPTGMAQPVIPSLQLAIVVLIVFETMIFVGLVASYMVLRNSSLAWPPPNLPRLPIAVTFANTLVLLASAWTMRASVVAVRGGLQPQFRRRLLATGALGTLFLVVQGSEWVQLIAQGLTLKVHVYGAMFYSLIGLHALHVVAAVVWLLALLALAWGGRFHAKHSLPVEACATYWYFVSGLWVVLFGIVYLY